MKETIEKEEGISECCGAFVYRDIKICSCCGDHTDVVKAEDEDDTRVEYLGHKHGN